MHLSCMKTKMNWMSMMMSYLHYQMRHELIERLDEITTYIDAQLSLLPVHLEESIELSLDHYADWFNIMVSSIPSERRGNYKIRNYGGLIAVPFTGNVYRKSGDIIYEKSHQLHEGKTNIIFIYADNDTHEEYDLFDSIFSINDLVKNSNSQSLRIKSMIQQLFFAQV